MTDDKDRMDTKYLDVYVLIANGHTLYEHDRCWRHCPIAIYLQTDKMLDNRNCILINLQTCIEHATLNPLRRNWHLVYQGPVYPLPSVIQNDPDWHQQDPTVVSKSRLFQRLFEYVNSLYKNKVAVYLTCREADTFVGSPLFFGFFCRPASA